MGRTLMQQALPTTFGLKAAGWLAGLDGARLRLAEVVAVAAGPVRRRGRHARRERPARASRCGRRSPRSWAWPTPPCPWHTVRLPIADLAGALGAAAGRGRHRRRRRRADGADRGGRGQPRAATRRGGSSAMPHKHNPVAAISARACARRAPGLVATLFGAMEQEHERAAGAWHSEWPTLTDLLTHRRLGRRPGWPRAWPSLRPDTARMAATVAAAARPGAGRRAGRRAGADARAAAPRTTRPPTPSARPRRPAGRCAEVLAGRDRRRRRRAARRPRPTSGRPARRSTPSSPTTPD